MAGIAAAAWAAQIADMSGTWRLDVAKSKWGKHPKPTSEEVVIEHHEPELKYSGTIVFPSGPTGGEETKKFSFSGYIDGKEYPVFGSLGEGQMSIRRVNPNTTVWEFKPTNGSATETATTRISADGRLLIREVHGKGAHGETSWTEVYDRK